MPLFKANMTRGGKFSLYLLIIATLLALFDVCAGRGRVAEWMAMTIGFPLMYIPWAIEQLQLFEKVDWEWVPKWLLLLIHILLWVGSCYIWGHIIAAGVWLVRPLLGKDDDQPEESGGQ